MAGYMPGREVPLGIIATTLEQLVPPDGHVIELGSGTSSWAAALCELMPAIRWTAVELDPLLTRIGQEVHGDAGGRLRRVQLDLRDPAWLDDVDPADAVVSVAALHMLGAELIAATYRAVHRILRPGGLLADLDYDTPAVSDPGLRRTLQDLAAARLTRAEPTSFSQHGAAMDADPLLARLRAQRVELLWPTTREEPPHLSARGHEAALRDAGFTALTTPWRDLDLALVLAIA